MNKNREFTLVDQQTMETDVSLPEFLANIASQSPDYLMIREGDTVTLKIELQTKASKDQLN